MSKPIQALGAYYFQPNSLPITVKEAFTPKDGILAHENDYTEVPHFHDFSELAIVINGQGLHHLEDDHFPVSAGDVFLLQGSQVHWFSQREDLTLLNVMYDPKRLFLPLESFKKIPGYSAIFHLEPTFRKSHKFGSRLHLDRNKLSYVQSIAERMIEEEKNDQPGCEPLLLSYLLELITYVSRQYGKNKQTESLALLRVSEVIAAMETNYSHPWTIDEFTEMAKLSRSHLFRLFKQATGQSLIDYLINIRLQKAQTLLRNTNFSVTEIAYKCGFSDGNYFTRQFRKIIRLTPTQYKQQYSLKRA